MYKNKFSRKNYKKINQNKKGFSLIEMIVVVAIIAILAVVTAVRWSSIKLDNELDTAATLLESNFQEMKNKTLAPKPTTLISEDSNVHGYGIRFLLNNNRFGVFTDSVDTGGNKIFCENRYVYQGNATCTAQDIIESSSNFENYTILNQVKIIKVEGIKLDNSSYEDSDDLTSTFSDEDKRFKSIVITANESVLDNSLWYGDRSCDCFVSSKEFKQISIIIEHNSTKKIKKVTLNFENNQIYVE